MESRPPGSVRISFSPQNPLPHLSSPCVTHRIPAAKSTSLLGHCCNPWHWIKSEGLPASFVDANVSRRPKHYPSKVFSAIDRRAFNVAAFDSQGYLALGFDFDYPYQPSPFYSASTASDLTLIGDQQFTPPTYYVGDISPPSSKRQRTAQPKHNPKNHTQMTALATTELAEERGPITAASSKPKRVRTGCLTCRERHLKCDEGSQMSADVYA